MIVVDKILNTNFKSGPKEGGDIFASGLEPLRVYLE